MYFVNRLVYSFIRPSKAKRSYLHSIELNNRGIQTPPPVAYYDIYSVGLLVDSFFVSAYQSLKTLEQVLKEVNYDPTAAKPVLKSLAGHAYKLHTHNIYHDDFSVGNILVMPLS